MLGLPNMEEYMKRWDCVHVDDAVGWCSELGDSDVGEGQRGMTPRWWAKWKQWSYTYIEGGS